MSKDNFLRQRIETQVRRSLLLFVIAADCIRPASAADSLDGKWNLSWKPTEPSACAGTPDIRDRLCEATLVVSGSGGTMRRFGTGFQKRVDPCLGIAYPVTIEAQSDSTATLKITGSTVLRDCPDFTLSLKLGDGGISEARMGDGALVNMRR